MKGLLIFLGIVGSLAVLLVFSYVSNYNYGNRAEQEIVATWENNQIILSQYGQKVAEAAQVPGMKTEDLQKVTNDAMTGRYGKEGSKAVFNWIQENYPGQVTDALYLQIQQIIEAGRNKFEAAQTRLIDQVRAYKTNLGYLWKGFWLRVVGYPKINLDDYKPISTDYADNAFKTGKESGPINLRPKTN